jgi:hypothetical protein
MHARRYPLSIAATGVLFASLARGQGAAPPSAPAPTNPPNARSTAGARTRTRPSADCAMPDAPGRASRPAHPGPQAPGGQPVLPLCPTAAGAHRSSEGGSSASGRPTTTRNNRDADCDPGSPGRLTAPPRRASGSASARRWNGWGALSEAGGVAAKRQEAVDSTFGSPSGSAGRAVFGLAGAHGLGGDHYATSRGRDDAGLRRDALSWGAGISRRAADGVPGLAIGAGTVRYRNARP